MELDTEKAHHYLQGPQEPSRDTVLNSSKTLKGGEAPFKAAKSK